MKNLWFVIFTVLLMFIIPVAALELVNDDFTVEYNYRIEMPESAPLAGNLLLNDITSGSIIQYIEVVEQPQHGVISLYSSGDLLYLVTDEGYEGIDTFTYRIFDGTSYSNIATVFISIITNHHVNDGEDAIYATPQNTELTGTLPCPLSDNNDIPYAIYGDPFGWEYPTPRHGQLILTRLDEFETPFTYIPENGFTGVDKFNYICRYDSP